MAEDNESSENSSLTNSAKPRDVVEMTEGHLHGNGSKKEVKSEKSTSPRNNKQIDNKINERFDQDFMIELMKRREIDEGDRQNLKKRTKVAERKIQSQRVSIVDAVSWQRSKDVDDLEIPSIFLQSNNNNNSRINPPA